MNIFYATTVAVIASLSITTIASAQEYSSCPDPNMGFQEYKTKLADCMSDAGRKLSQRRLDRLLQDEVNFTFGITVEALPAANTEKNFSQLSVMQEGLKYRNITRLVAAQPNRIYGIHKSLLDNIERLQLEKVALPAPYETLKSEMLGSFAQTLPLVGQVASSEKPQSEVSEVEETASSEEKTETAKSGDEAEEPKEPEQIEPPSDTAAAEPSGNNIFAIAGGVGVLAAGGGGGGGGGGGLSDGQYRNTAVNEYGTEFYYQSMLSSIHALSLNNYGYSGEGVNVAVVDTGIDSTHPEFDGKTINGHDFANSASGYGADEQGHGSHVASIIAGERDGSGMRGFAYDANLYDYKAGSSLEALATDSQIAAVFNRHVTDNIHVSNNSWGSGSSITSITEVNLRALYPNTIAAMRAAQTNGTLIVFSAGNDGYFNPDIDGGLPYRIAELANEWLVVVAVDSNLTETNYTNRCGVAADFCVTAPGGGDTQATDGILAARANGTVGDEYVRFSGTSMAAPHVSGLAAALMEKFPSLTPAQVATRIKSTASYSGLTGSGGQTTANSSTATMQAIFGHGLVNATAASARIGNYIYANGGNLENGTNVTATRIAIPIGLPASVQNQIVDSKFIVFDSFDGARFSVDGSQVFSKFSGASTPSFSTTTMIDTHNDPSFGFVSSEGNLNTPDWIPRFITFSSNGRETASKAFWGELSSLFPASKMVQDEPSASYIWNQSYKGLNFQPFVQFRNENFGISSTSGNGVSNLGSDSGLDLQPLDHLRNENNSTNSISSYGASFNIEFDGGLKFTTGYKVSNGLMNNGITQYEASSGHSLSTELGFVQKVGSSSDLFFRATNNRFHDIGATHRTFGLKNAEEDSWTLGYSTHSKLGNFAWGVSKANQLSQGSVSLITPTGRTRAGDVLYIEQHFTIHDDERLERFFAYNYEFSDGYLTFGLVEDQDGYGSIGAAKLNFSMQF